MYFFLSLKSALCDNEDWSNDAENYYIKMYKLI